MTKKITLLLSCLLLLLLAAAGPAYAAPTVRCVLFYSPSCPHCHQVITEDLPPLIEQYGEQLLIAGIDTSQEQGQAFYQAAIRQFQIPENRRGVPTLIIGNTVLVGSLEIPQQLPGLVALHLDQGGVDWPAIPGLAEIFADAGVGDTDGDEAAAATPAVAAATATPPLAAATATPTAAAAVAAAGPVAAAPADGFLYPLPESDPVTVFGRDPAGNTLSFILLLGMVGLVAGTATHVARVSRRQRATVEPRLGSPSWLLPLLIFVGLSISAYMAFVETTETVAVCGPVGDCNTVQQSEYARLFGLLPIGILGVFGYLLLGFTWAVAYRRDDHLRRRALVTLFLLAFAGTLFSIYLTFLEPFVIGATCLWCLSSALVMSLILFLVTGPGSAALIDLLRSTSRTRATQPQE